MRSLLFLPLVFLLTGCPSEELEPLSASFYECARISHLRGIDPHNIVCLGRDYPTQCVACNLNECVDFACTESGCLIQSRGPIDIRK